MRDRLVRGDEEVVNMFPRRLRYVAREFACKR